MIRGGMRTKVLRQEEQERLARAEQVSLAYLHERWKVFSLPVQSELQFHFACFGLIAAEHATFLVERVFSERKSTS